MVHASSLWPFLSQARISVSGSAEIPAQFLTTPFHGPASRDRAVHRNSPAESRDDNRSVESAEIRGQTRQMSDHHIMSGMAMDFRRQAELAEDPARRAFLLELSDYCRRMALAMQRRSTPQADQIE